MPGPRHIQSIKVQTFFLNGVKLAHRLATGAKAVTSVWSSHFVIDASGNVWSWGTSNVFGQLGHGDIWACETPAMIEMLKSTNEISTNDNYSVACVTKNNTCYVWGNCDLFRLGSKVTRPIKSTDRPIKSISLGAFHALTITDDDEVHAIGDNSDGELGVGDLKKRSTWTKVIQLTGRVIKVQCGSFCSAILTTTGVFTLGVDEFGGDTPKLVIELGSMVADISLKNAHILALTSNGELYAWGSNWCGACGVGLSDGDIEKPTRVRGTKAYHIRQISAGCDYSLIRCTRKRC